MEPSDAPELYAIAQFVVPRIVAEALDLQRIRRELGDAGVVGTNIEMGTRGAGAGKVRVTCRTLVALRLIAEWKRLGERAPHTEDGVRFRDGVRLASEAATAGCCEAWSPRQLSMGESRYGGYVGPSFHSH